VITFGLAFLVLLGEGRLVDWIVSRSGGPATPSPQPAESR
jgi:hypothetical protein